MTLGLFLGFPLQNSIEKCISHLGRDEHSLILVKKQGGVFLGKKLGNSIDCEGLHNAEANIYSLLNKLIPDFPFQETSLVLFPYDE